jgi:hypothetical protein
MKVVKRWIEDGSCWVLPLIVWCGFFLLACSPMPKAQSAMEPHQNHDAVWPAYEEGLTAFQRGDYERAQRCFEGVSKHAVSEGLRRKGLYGLACTRLLVAQTAEEYQAALHLWGLWNQLGSPELGEEDPRMIALILPRLYPTELTRISATSQLAPQNPSKIGNTQAVKVVKDRECEKQLRESDREVQRLKRQIRTLRLQIEALETIHRRIQEKKKEVSPP